MQADQSIADIVTVLNLKGGVGKSHTVWLTAAVCQERQQRVLLIDIDTQANLTSSFLRDDESIPGVEAVFDPGADATLSSLIRQTAYSHIDIVPASSLLAPVDLSDQAQWESSDLHLSFVDALDAVREEYDLIIFDCPPRLSLVSFAALCASDGVIVPMEAADWGAQGIVQVTDAISYVQSRFNPQLTLLGYLVSRFKRARAYQQSYLSQLRAHFGELAFDTVVPDLAQFEKSVTDRVPIVLHAPRSEEARIARKLFDELIARQRHSGSSNRGCQPDLCHAEAALA